MEWLNALIGLLAAALAGLNIFQLVSFRQYKKKYAAEAAKEEAEAVESKQSALERRLNALEHLYAEQGKMVDELRTQILQISQAKFESDKRIVQLEGENKTLNEKFVSISKELEAYKVIAGNK